MKNKMAKKKQPKNKITTQVISLLNDEYAVRVVLGKPKDVQKYLLQKIDKDMPACDSEFDVRGKTWHLEGRYPIIWVSPKLKGSEFYATLAHEAVHAVRFIFEYIGEESVDEVFAHSVGAIVRNVKLK
jgi:hypothetical protein